MFQMTIISRALLSASEAARAAHPTLARLATTTAAGVAAQRQQHSNKPTFAAAVAKRSTARCTARNYTYTNTGSHTNTNTNGYVAAPGTCSHASSFESALAPAQSATNTDIEAAERISEFRRFYETVSNTRELAPTPLGHGGSERILNNTLLHRTPWQASCVELRERASTPQDRCVLSYGAVDFTALRRHGNTTGSTTPNRYTHTDCCGGAAPEGEAAPEGSVSCGAAPPLPALEVVHYYETSSAAGLAGYQSIAMMVRKGLLPGQTQNFSAEGGFAVWTVPHADYVALLTSQGFLEA